MRIFVALAATSLLAGCVQPTYAPGPIDLQNYGALPAYRSAPAYREPLPPPVPMPLPDVGSAPTAEPLPPPTDLGPPATDQTGPIPLQDMPQPVPDASSAASQSAAPQDAPHVTTAPKIPTSGPGSNVPLEGFRPMRGQTKPTP
jgi:hypothetical protein